MQRRGDKLAAAATCNALPIYAYGLAGGDVQVEYADGRVGRLPVQRWLADQVPGDAGLIRRAGGPVLDVGCGPGRLTAALAALGTPALGIDISAAAVALTRAAGGAALCRDVFAALPGVNRWPTILLADGNVGIGGHPIRLLERVAALLAPSGRILLETDPPTVTSRRTQIRLHGGGATSPWFGWAHVGAGDVPAFAARVGLRRSEYWTEAERWFAVLTPR